MDDTNSSRAPAPVKSKQPNSLAYLAIGLTLVVALMQLWGSIKGRPSQWPELALLITLFCGSMASIMESKRVKMILSISGIIFSLVAIYGFATNIAHR
jgi:membrane-associated HD superfamily phosphohydrolase